MPCTTILVGKKASHDGSTMIARNEDVRFEVKKLTVVEPEQQPKKYKSVEYHFELELPENPMRYTACPNADPYIGVWGAAGINEANVAMTATETITTNPRVMGADPLVEYRSAEGEDGTEQPGGIGEEDLVTILLPYIHTAREGVLRLGKLLEEIGTSESNGIAFSDKDEIWWLETIGGHHWIARRVGDEECVVMPNQFGLDRFDFDDAFGAQKENMCSADLKEFIEKNHLSLNMDGGFNPRLAFGAYGSRTDFDHAYNTPRAWYLGRCLCPTKYRWDGDGADFTPTSDNIPWAFVPERRLTPEDVKRMLSSYYQGTEYNVYSSTAKRRGAFRPIGVKDTGSSILCQIRGYMPEPLQGVQWVSLGCMAFNASLPVYANARSMPEYLSNITREVTTNNFYWGTQLISVLADAHYADSAMQVERYQSRVPWRGRAILNAYDKKMIESGKFDLCGAANEELAAMAKEETVTCLGNVLRVASEHMKNGYNRSDN